MNSTQHHRISPTKLRLTIKGNYYIYKDTMGEGRKLKYVAVVKNAEAEETYILNQMDEKNVK